MENIIASDAAMYFGAALCTIPMAASAWGVAKLWIAMIETVGRNPQVKKDVDTYGWAGFAAVEAIALYCLVVALIMLNK